MTLPIRNIKKRKFDKPKIDNFFFTLLAFQVCTNKNHTGTSSILILCKYKPYISQRKFFLHVFVRIFASQFSLSKTNFCFKKEDKSRVRALINLYILAH